MSNSYFSFKQFTIYHDKCAMKVGTDGVLLGAWTPTNNAMQILDVGTGTGLISLQLAQRSPTAQITAVEIDAIAAEQARDNVTRSPWAERIKIICCDFKNYQSENKFDLIVSNPPYFIDALKCPIDERTIARHSGNLNYELLFSKSAHLLNEEGLLSIIVPAETEKHVLDVAWNNKLFLQQRTNVYTKPGKKCRRLLLCFGLSNTEHEITNELYIESSQGGFTTQYINLTKDFYLKM